MELLEGRTLKQTISYKPLPLETVIDFGVQIAAAIDAAHAKGVVHRDIKPANIFVMKQRRIKVLDFGLAKLTRLMPNFEETGLTGGTEPGMVTGAGGTQCGSHHSRAGSVKDGLPSSMRAKSPEFR